MVRFQILPDATGGFRWRLVGDAGEAVALSCQRYTTLDSCRRSVSQVKSSLYGASIEELTQPKTL